MDKDTMALLLISYLLGLFWVYQFGDRATRKDLLAHGLVMIPGTCIGALFLMAILCLVNWVRG